MPATPKLKSKAPVNEEVFILGSLQVSAWARSEVKALHSVSSVEFE